MSETALADTVRSVRGGGYTPEGQSEEEETHIDWTRTRIGMGLLVCIAKRCFPEV